MSEHGQTQRGLIGMAVLTGIAAALALHPHARNTVSAQVSLALGHRPEWLRATTARPDGTLPSRINNVLAAHPDAVALHLGAATLPTPMPAGEADTIPRWREAEARRVLARLDDMARRFPDDVAVRAAQVQYLCMGASMIRRTDEVWVDGRTASPHYRLGELSTTTARDLAVAAEAGVRLEPDNSFFPTMQAVASFALHQDRDALKALRRAARKPRWDDHWGESARAQWVLLETTYGRRDWLQKLTASVFPFYGFAHRNLVRSAAMLALRHSWQLQQAGEAREAQALRRDLIDLGAQFRNNPQEEEQNLGHSLFRLATGRVPIDNGPWRIESLRRLEQYRRSWYLRFLRSHGMEEEAARVEAEGEKIAEASARLTEAQQAREVAGIRREVWLAVGWAVALVLLKQIGTLLLLGVVAAGLAWYQETGRGAPVGMGSAVGLALLLFLAPFAAVAAIGSDHRWAGSFEAAVAACLLVLGGGVWLFTRSRRGEPNGAGHTAAVWILLYLATFLTPLALIAFRAEVHFMWAYLGGVVLLGLLAAAHAAGRHDVELPDRPRWRPGLVALATVGLTTLSLLLAPAVLLRPDGILGSLGIVSWISPESDYRGALPVLVLLPAALLLFLQLCRVAALRQPLGAGLGRGLRQTVPYAIALLLTLYLANLVPTLASERAVEQEMDRMVGVRN